MALRLVPVVVGSVGSAVAFDVGGDVGSLVAFASGAGLALFVDQPLLEDAGNGLATGSAAIIAAGLVFRHAPRR